MLNRWQKTVVDRQGNVMPWAALMIRKEADQMPATVYSDREGTDPYPAGQVTADGNGFAFFYAQAGVYRITAQSPAIDWRDVGIGAPFDPDALGTAAARDVTTSSTDSTAGRVLRVGDFGVGGNAPLLTVGTDLDTLVIPGSYTLAGTYPNSPLGAATTTTGVIEVIHRLYPGAGCVQIAYLGSLGFWMRQFSDGVVGTAWVELYHSGNSGNLSSDLQWLGTPVGGYITPLTPPPKDDPRFRYVLCTAGETGSGKYNNGILTGETVTGTAPLVNAVATVSLAGSPFNGMSIHLINTEGRFVGAGASEAFEDDALQNIPGALTGVSATGASGAFTALGAGAASIVNEANSRMNITFDPSRVARTSDHTQPRTHRLPHYRRIL